MIQKIVLLYIVGTMVLFGSEGEEVYKQKCASCHEAFIPVEKLMENFMSLQRVI